MFGGQLTWVYLESWVFTALWWSQWGTAAHYICVDTDTKISSVAYAKYSNKLKQSDKWSPNKSIQVWLNITVTEETVSSKFNKKEKQATKQKM